MRRRISLLTSLLAPAATVAFVGCLIAGCASVGSAGGTKTGGTTTGGSTSSGGKVASASKATTDFHEIVIVSADGMPTYLAALLGRRPALVSFWAPWCESCVRELPDLERLARTMSACGAAVLGVAVGETPTNIAAFTHSRQLTYPQFADERFELADALGQKRIPTTVVFDGSQNIVYVGDGLDQRAVAALATTLGISSSGCSPTASF